MEYQGDRRIKRSHDQIDRESSPGTSSDQDGNQDANSERLRGDLRRDKRQENKQDRKERAQRSEECFAETSLKRSKDRAKGSQKRSQSGNRGGGSPESGGIVVYASNQIEDKLAVKSEFDLNYDETRRLHTNLMKLTPKQKEAMYEVINDQLAESNFKSTNLKDVAGYRNFERAKKK